MKERLDCALISIPGCERLVQSLLKHERLQYCRLHLTLVEPADNSMHGIYPGAAFLQNMTYSLRHFDAICLPVSPDSLAWTRILLQQTRIEQHRPIFVLGQSLRPIGLIDLIELGVVDFALWPCDPEEVRVRLLRALRELRDQRARPPSLLGDSVSTQQYAMCESTGASNGPYLSPASAVHMGPGMQGLALSRSTDRVSPSGTHALQRPGAAAILPSGRALPAHSLLGALSSAVHRPASHPALPEIPRVCCQEIAQYPEGFQQLKSVVVAQFERTYLTHALARSKGNIAQAARNSQKHRRAFWALMRKHQISADPFRDAGF